MTLKNQEEIKMGLITNEIRDFVNREKLGFIATVCPDGSPNLSPKGTTIAWDTDHLAFADIHSPGTVGNLLLNPSVEINIVDIFIRKGYRFKGTAHILSDGELFKVIVAYFKSTGIEHSIKNIVLVKIGRIQPLLSPAYDYPTTEDEIRDRWIKYWDEINSADRLSPDVNA